MGSSYDVETGERDLASVGPRKPATMRNVVLLPAPLGPRNPTTSPFSTRNDTSRTANDVPL